LKKKDGANKQSEVEQKKKAKTALYYDDPVIMACKEEFDDHQGPGWEGLVGQKVCGMVCLISVFQSVDHRRAGDVLQEDLFDCVCSGQKAFF
jgi:hypothetical protein